MELEAAVRTHRNESSKLEDNLNKIYKLCGQYRSFNLTPIFNQTTNTSFAEILDKSEEYLQQMLLFSKNSFDLKFLEEIQKETFVAARDDEERTYFYPTIFEHFDDMKKFLRFHLQMNGAYVNVTMTVPYAEEGNLYEITYVPVLSSSGEVIYLKDQSVSHLIESHYSLRYETDLDSCQFQNEVFLCNPKHEKIKHILNSKKDCLTSLYKGETSHSCSYENAQTDLFQLTSLGDGNFYYLMKDPRKYTYECLDDEFEVGYLQGSGVLGLEPNCSLTTEFESIFYDGEIEELTIFISDDLNDSAIFGRSAIPLIAIIFAAGAFLFIALFFGAQLLINRRDQYRYMNV